MSRRKHTEQSAVATILNGSVSEINETTGAILVNRGSCKGLSVCSAIDYLAKFTSRKVVFTDLVKPKGKAKAQH